MPNLIVISHLRWDFVWQRPQHLLSRLAGSYPLLFVEEPVAVTDGSEPELALVERSTPDGATVTVARLLQPVSQERWIGHNDPLTQQRYAQLLSQYLDEKWGHDNLLWLYTPMALPFVDDVAPKLLIYDVMDELAAFKGAPAQLAEFDEQLLGQADIVFTGGLSLYRKRQAKNDETHLFPSGVEIEHFAQAADRGAFELPADMPEDGKRLGYFGVIDERMDLALIEQLADADDTWQIVMIGPVVKIDPADLPKRPNIHYLGMKDYAELPAYLAHFDVALVPFAINEATRYLSPTKTLEYMAAHVPIVSTPIHDIVELYGDYVGIGYDHEQFIEQTAAAFRQSAAERNERRTREKQLLDRYRWDNIAAAMRTIINRKLGEMQPSGAHA